MFEKGHQKVGGRKPSIKTQLKRFEEKHPEAYDKLMEVLYDSGLDGHSLDAQYVIDRLKGKPTSKIGIDEIDKELLTVATVLAFRKLVDTNLLEEGSIDGEYTETEGAIEVTDAEDA